MPVDASIDASPALPSRTDASLPPSAAPSVPASPIETTQRPMETSHVRPAAQSMLVRHSGTVITTVEAGGCTMPIASTCAAPTVTMPEGRSRSGVKVQLPIASTVARPTSAPLTVMTTISPGVPVPEIIGRLLVTTAPVMGEVITGGRTTQRPALAPIVAHIGSMALGQSIASRIGSQPRHARVVLSQIGVPPPHSALVVHVVIVNVMDAPGMPVVPPSAPASAPPPVTGAPAIVCMPALRSIVGVKVKLPSASVLARPTSMPSIKIATVLFGAPTPRMSGRREPVIEPLAGSVIVTLVATQRPAFAPLDAHIGRGALQSVAIAGSHGRHKREVPSHTGVAPRHSLLLAHIVTVNETLVPCGPTVVPLTLAAAAVCIPPDNPLVSAKLQLPDPSAVASPTATPSMYTRTVAPGAAVPRTMGRVSVELEPFIGLVTTGGVETHVPEVLPIVEQNGATAIGQSIAALMGEQPRQTLVVVLQIGVEPAQCMLLVHVTHC